MQHSLYSAIRYSSFLLDNGFNVCSFDFAGCGNSEGEYVSLGYHEKIDIMEIIRFICRNYQIWNFILWGRSMGASCIISFFEYFNNLKRTTNEMNFINIICCVLDSPFSSLSKLAIQIAQRTTSIPQLFLKAVFLIIKSTIESKADFKIDELELIKYIHNIDCPVLILASQQDTLVKYSHSQQIYSNLKCSEKQLIFIKGQHHQMRDNQTINRVVRFIIKHSKIINTDRKKEQKSVSKNKYIETSKSLHKQTFHQLTPTQQNGQTQIPTPPHQHLQHHRINSNHQENGQINITFKTNPNIYNHYLQRRQSITDPPSKGSNSIYVSRLGNMNIEAVQFQRNKINSNNQKNEQTFRNKVQQVTIKLFHGGTTHGKMANQQHLNVINNKLKKRKRDNLNYHQFSRTNQQFHKTYKVSNAHHNLQKSIHFHQSPQCQIPTNCFQTHTFIPQTYQQVEFPKSTKKYSQRVNTAGNLQNYEGEKIDLNKKCKNVFSMKDFGNSVRLFKPQTKQTQEQDNYKHLSKIVKHRNKNQLKSSKKCINLKSPKTAQQVLIK